jgi:hypothetical protein
MTSLASFKVENKPVRKPTKAYQLDKMKVGQSFFVHDESILPSLRTTVSLFGRCTGKKFSVKKEGSGWRCGRMK